MRLEKVWVSILMCGSYKGLILEKTSKIAKIELVGYPFGTHPNGKILNNVPLDRLTRR